MRLWKATKASPRPDVLSELVRLLDNRYLLGERVYFHRAKLVSGAMLADAVQREKSAGKLSESDLWDIGDEALLDRLTRSEQEPVRTLAQNVQSRHLWKEIYSRNRQQIEAEQTQRRDADLMQQTMQTWWRDSTKRQEDQDYIGRCSGLELGRLLLYCPDERMNLKLADMKVFWNGALIPLRDCKDEPVVGPKLTTILESHRQLWAVRAFLSPEHEDKKATCVEGLVSLLSFDDHSRNLAGSTFYTDVVRQIADANGFTTLPHDEYERHQASAIERIMSHTASKRTPELVEQMVKDAFSQQ